MASGLLDRRPVRSGSIWLMPVVFGLALSATPLGVTSGGAHVRSLVDLSDCYSADNGRPSLSSLSVSPEVLDVRRTDGQVTVRATASDTGGPGDPTGIVYFRVRLDSPKVDEYLYLNLHPDEAGGWSGAVTIERGWTSGTWTVTWVKVSDAAKPWGNSREYVGAELIGLATTQQVTVVSATDGKAPTLTDFQVSGTSLNTRRSAKSVAIRAGLRDADSGVRAVWVSAEHTRRNRYIATQLKLIAGGTRRGIWSGELPIRQWNVDGSWAIAVTARDRSGERRSWGSGRLRRLGFPATLQVVSGRDDGRPAASAFTIEPKSVDLRTNDQRVTVRLRAIDAQAGVGKVRVEMNSPSGRRVVSNISLHRVTGSARDGVWEAAVPLQRCRSEAGIWTASVQIADRVGHDRTYSAPPLIKLAMEAHDHLEPGMQFSGRQPLAGPFVMTFNEDVQGITPATVPVRRQGSTLVAGGWDCVDASQAATDCATGAVRTARFVPAEPFRQVFYSVEVNPEHTLGVTDLAGNPHPREDVAFFRPE